MFYFKECYLRFIYFIYSYIIIMFIFFLKKETLILFINYKIFKKFYFHKVFFETIIYNSPTELLTTYIYIIFYFSTFNILPYFLWTFFDFFQSGIQKNTHKTLKFILYYHLVLTLIILFYSFNVFYPQIWYFFKTINKFFEQSIFLNFYYQLQFKKYFVFLISFLKIIMICYTMIFICGLISFLFNFNFLIKFRKLFILINLTLATIISPPDIFSQLFFFILFNLLFESLLLFFIYLIKYEKYFIYNGKKLNTTNPTKTDNI